MNVFPKTANNSEMKSGWLDKSLTFWLREIFLGGNFSFPSRARIFFFSFSDSTFLSCVRKEMKKKKCKVKIKHFFLLCRELRQEKIESFSLILIRIFHRCCFFAEHFSPMGENCSLSEMKILEVDQCVSFVQCWGNERENFDRVLTALRWESSRDSISLFAVIHGNEVKIPGVFWKQWESQMTIFRQLNLSFGYESVQLNSKF